MTPIGSRPRSRPRPTARSAAASGVLSGLVVSLLTGCGAPAVRVDGARDTVRVFEGALAARDYSAACDVLAPETRAQLQQDEEQACAQALASQELPVSAAVGTPEVYGRQALVRTGGETLFLSQFRSGWRVVAAGCSAQAGKPYECRVKGS